MTTTAYVTITLTPWSGALPLTVAQSGNTGSGMRGDDSYGSGNTSGRMGGNDSYGSGNTGGSGLGSDSYGSGNTGSDTYGSSNTSGGMSGDNYGSDKHDKHHKEGGGK